MCHSCLKEQFALNESLAPRYQQLDVYYPPVGALPASGKIPVLYFFYGGGFFEGDRRLPHPYGLVYTNTGAYFAKRG